MTEPIRSSRAGSGGISATALADLLGRWPAADGPLYRLLATRIARLADTGELPPGLRLPPERDLAGALSVSRNTVAAAYQLLRDEGMAESRQGAGTRIVPHRTTPAAVHRANGFFAGLLETSAVDADLSLAAVDCAPQVAAALADPAAVLGERLAVTGTSGYFPLGLPALRTAIAEHLANRLGLPADPAGIPTTWAPARCSASSTPGKVGSSTATGWPGSTSHRISRSIACWPPVVTITWAGSAGSPRRFARCSAMAVRSAGSPSGK